MMEGMFLMTRHPFSQETNKGGVQAAVSPQMIDQLIHAAVLYSELISIHGRDGQIGTRQQVACIAHLQPAQHPCDTQAHKQKAQLL